tara:strand:- start:75 stop:359 length:285 start_codon:yes stop_codon:yes gene_type:complete
MSQQHKVGTHKTTTRTEGNTTKVCYHSTVVCSFNNKEINLNTGGWFTSTTKTRMNQTSNQYNLGFTVYQKDYNWFVNYDNKIHSFNQNKLTIKR